MGRELPLVIVLAELLRPSDVLGRLLEGSVVGVAIAVTAFVVLFVVRVVCFAVYHLSSS